MFGHFCDHSHKEDLMEVCQSQDLGQWAISEWLGLTQMEIDRLTDDTHLPLLTNSFLFANSHLPALSTCQLQALYYHHYKSEVVPCS